MLHAAETWVMTAATLNRLRRYDCVRFLQKNQRAITPQWEITFIRKNMGQLFSYEVPIYQISRVQLQRYKSYNI